MRGKLVALVLLVLLPMFGLQVVGLRARPDRERERELQANKELAEAIALAFASHLENLWDSEFALGRMIVRSGASPSADDARSLMVAQLSAHPTVAAFAWLSPTGIVLSATNPALVSLNTSGQDHVARVIRGEDRVISDVFRSALTGEPVVVALRAIRPGGRLAGIVAAKIDLSRLSVALPLQRRGAGAFGLIDRSGLVVYRNIDPDLPFERRGTAPDSSSLRALRGETSVFTGEPDPAGGGAHMGAAVPIPLIGWAAFASVPVDEALAGVRAELGRDVLALLLAATASLTAAGWLGGRLLRPIFALEQAALAISRGNLEARVRVLGDDEVAATTAAFNEMADRVEAAERQLRVRARQQAAVAELGQRSLAGADLATLMADAARLVVEVLEVELCGVLELLPDGSLRLRAGAGWREGCVGNAVVGPGAASQAGYTLLRRDPVIAEELPGERRFVPSLLLREHGATSGMSVVIPGPSRPLGVLSAHSRQRRSFSRDDVNFLQAIANVLGASIDRRCVDDALRESNNKLQAIFRASPLPVIALDLQDRVTMWNEAAERVFGWTAAEVLGRQLPIVPEECLAQTMSDLDRVRRGESIVGVASRRVRRDGTPLDVVVSREPLHDAEGHISGTVSLFADVTGPALFLQVAAHELRNPMTTVKGTLSLLRRRLATGRPIDHAAQMLEIMEGEVDRLATHLNEILEAFRVQQGRMSLRQERVDLVEIVHSALRPFQAAADRHRFVVERADPDPIWVFGDLRRLEEVMRNLIGNAVKYSPDGGEVRVRLGTQDGRARVSVTDSGVGIPAEQLTMVFESFFRGSNLAGRDPGGIGLGLYICREIVQRHGGRIWVESADGAGATFHVDLPLDAREGAA